MRIVVRISDPWDLGEPIEWKPLEGTLLQIIEDEQGGKALIVLDHGVAYRGAEWRYLVASVRHMGDKIAMLQSGKKVFSSMIGISNEQAASAQPLDTGHWRGGLALIGDIEPRP